MSTLFLYFWRGNDLSGSGKEIHFFLLTNSSGKRIRDDQNAIQTRKILNVEVQDLQGVTKELPINVNIIKLLQDQS